MPCLFWVHVQFEYTLMFFGRCFSTAEFWEGGPMKKIQSGRHWEVIRSFTTCLGFIVWLDFRTYTQDHHMNLIKANFKFTNLKVILNHVVDLGISRLSLTRNNEEKYRLLCVEPNSFITKCLLFCFVVLPFSLDVLFGVFITCKFSFGALKI